MIARILHLPLDKSKLILKHNVHSVKEWMTKYMIENKTVYDTLDQIGKNPVLYLYFKQHKSKRDDRGMVYAIHSRLLGLWMKQHQNLSQQCRYQHMPKKIMHETEKSIFPNMSNIIFSMRTWRNMGTRDLIQGQKFNASWMASVFTSCPQQLPQWRHIQTNMRSICPEHLPFLPSTLTSKDQHQAIKLHTLPRLEMPSSRRSALFVTFSKERWGWKSTPKKNMSKW